MIIPRSHSKPASLQEKRAVFAVCAGLVALVLLVFGQTLRNGFVNFDDNDYVYENPAVTAGLTLKGIASAFSLGESDNWVPLTTISHMLDCQIYGVKAGGHHLTNVVLHSATVILLFLVLRQMTGFLWRSAFVAAVLAVHPLHVESVAWVSERKDCLSGLFFMLTLWAYVCYVRRSGSLLRYLTVLFLFACGLMSKPMLVTLPFVLLLLDYWPLNRFSNIESVHWLKNLSISARLILEKIPLLIFCLGSCILTVLAQNHAIQSLNQSPFSTRLGNALVSCVIYLWQMFYPAKLAVLYPYPINGLPIWEVVCASMVMVLISLGAFLWRQRRPYLLVGWLWYLGMLVPVIGLVQVGNQALADRYTYLSQIGLYLMLVWLVAELSAAWRNRRLMLSSLASFVIIVLVFLARLQTSYWKNSETLWMHTLVCTSDNALALYGFGDALLQEKRVDVAIIQLKKALAINPDYAPACNILGSALFQKGRVDDAIIQYQKALAIDPKYAEACYNLGAALAQKGQVDEAIIQYQKALAIDPNSAEACYDLGDALAQKGQMDEAIIQFQNALTINPNYAEAYYALGDALAQKWQVDDAIIQFQKALAINPNFAPAYFDLGDALIQKGLVDEAIIQFQKALAINPNFAAACYNLGSALAQKGQMDEAIIQFQKTLAIQPGFVAAQNRLIRITWVMATSPNPSLRNGTKAVELAKQTDRLTGGSNPTLAATLAAADAEAGNFPEAITNVQRALKLASSQNDDAMIATLQAQLKCYQAGFPVRTSGAVP